MIEGLERFVVELRQAGLVVSPAEWIEGVRAALEVSLADRERFRIALRASLVKRRDDRERFDEAFDRFFSAPRSIGRGKKKGRAGAEGEAGRRRTQAAGSRAREVRRELKAKKDGRRSPEPWKAAAEGRRPTGRLRHVLLAPHLERTARTLLSAGQEPPDERDLSRRLTVPEEREIAAEVPRLVRRIRLASGRRYRRSRRGKLHLRRVFRESLAHDGVPFTLPRRRLRRRRTRLVLLVDVSWSVARAAGLFLEIAGEMVVGAPRTRVIAFVDRTRESTAEVEAWLAGRASAALRSPRAGAKPGAGIVRGGMSFADLASGLDQLDLSVPSDYGRAFHRLFEARDRPRGRDTVLVVLGDGRTNHFDPQAWAFEEVAARCGAVLWLVPEPRERWSTGDSALAEYLPHCDVAVEARDLSGLARGVAEIVRRLRR